MLGKLQSVARVLRHKGPRSLAAALWYLSRANFNRRVLGRPMLRKRIHGARMDLDTRDKGIGRTLILFGSREEDHRLLLHKVLEPGMTVLDIGANIGYYALMERALVGAEGLVIAVEPSSANLALLEHNAELNGHGNIRFLHMAVSDREGTAELLLSPFSNLHSFHARAGPDRQTGATEVVRTGTVASIAARYGKPDLIRMDVEGHEVEILRGMADAVERGELIPLVVFETHLRHYTPDHDFEAPLRRLFRSGYTVRWAASSGEDGSRRVEALGYRGGPPIATDFTVRRLFENLAEDDAVSLICRTGGLRTVLLAPPSGG